MSFKEGMRRQAGKANLMRWPLRKIVSTEGGIETLECGHRQAQRQDLVGPTNAYRRRCQQCAAELNRRAGAIEFLRAIYATACRELADPGDETGDLVEIATLCEEALGLSAELRKTSAASMSATQGGGR